MHRIRVPKSWADGRAPRPAIAGWPGSIGLVGRRPSCSWYGSPKIEKSTDRQARLHVLPSGLPCGLWSRAACTMCERSGGRGGEGGGREACATWLMGMEWGDGAASCAAASAMLLPPERRGSYRTGGRMTRRREAGGAVIRCKWPSALHANARKAAAD